MTQEFKQAVQQHDLASVRMMLSNELLFDPRGESFGEMLAYAKDNLPDLFETERPSRFSIPSEPKEWNADVLSKMKRDLNINFSVEKLALFVEMAKFLGKDKAETLNDNETKNKSNDSKNTDSSHEVTTVHRKISRKKAGTIVTGSGAIIAITGLFVEGSLGTVLTIAGGVVAVGGVILLSVPKKQQP